MVSVLCIIVLIILLYIIKSYMTQLPCNSNYYEYMTNSDIIIRWFHRPGCHHCDNMKSEWIKLKNSGLPTKYKFVDVDTTLSENKKLVLEYKVDGVPHIVKCTADGNFQVYNGDRNMKNMRRWIISK